MNYVREINAFYDRLEINPLSVSAIALWYALMHICNKAGWPVNFSVAVSVLSIKSGLKERTVYLARNELKQKGYIDFQSRKGNQSATYKINSLCLSLRNVSENNHHYVVPVTNAGNHSESHSQGLTHNSNDNDEALIKQKQTKQKEVKKEENSLNPFVFYEGNGFGTLSPIVIEDINYWLSYKEFTEPELIVMEAMKQAVMNNARNWNYVSTILIDWSNRKLASLKDIKAHQASWQQNKSNVATFKRKPKGQDEVERNKRRDRPDYTRYDFGF